MEYQKKHSTGGFGMGLAGVLTGGAALLGQATSGNGILGNAFGAPRAYPAPWGGYAPAVAPFVDGCCGGGVVTEKEIKYVREVSEKDATIARLEAEKYADAAVMAATAPLNNRVCQLETAAAVNAARDGDFRRYVEREFVHQPKASIRESIVVCKQCGCECDCH